MTSPGLLSDLVGIIGGSFSVACVIGVLFAPGQQKLISQAPGSDRLYSLADQMRVVPPMVGEAVVAVLSDSLS